MSTAERSTPPPAPGPPPPIEDDDEPLLVPDDLVEAFLITDPDQVRSLKLRRERSPSAFRDEVWDGIYVMSPDANSEHQEFVGQFTFIFLTIVERVGGGRVFPGLNVSDRVEDWMKNYRIPDVAVYLPGNPAVIHKAHACGGPDLAVEILSRGDRARKKLDFYAQVGTRELILLDRGSWKVELYRLVDAKLALVGISTPEGSEVLTSAVLPITLRLLPGEGRPTLEVAAIDGGQAWRI